MCCWESGGWAGCWEGEGCGEGAGRLTASPPASDKPPWGAGVSLETFRNWPHRESLWLCGPYGACPGPSALLSCGESHHRHHIREP